MERNPCGRGGRRLPALLVLTLAGCATRTGELEVPTADPMSYYGLTAKPRPDPVAPSQHAAGSEVRPVRHNEPKGGSATVSESGATLPGPLPAPADSCPIDLPTALRLAGANNLQIALAAERLRQAEARLDGANALWLPSVNVGAGYNSHAGRIQDTSGQILDVRRNSLFVGGGPVVGNFPLPGGAGPPPRLFMGIPLADAVFTRLAERQQVAASRADTAAALNDNLLRVGLAYLDLMTAHQQVGIARDAETNAKELVRLVESRVKAGTTLPADGLRASAELADRERQSRRAEEVVRVASAELGRLLRLDPAIMLVTAETQPVPIDFVDPATPFLALAERGLTHRPEMARNQALVRASLEQLRQEKWRPWVPSAAVGYSAGGFGGGTGDEISKFGGRGDFDAVLAWEFRNLGFGNRALQRDRSSLLAQANLTAEQAHDDILADIARTHHQVKSRRDQIEAARRQLAAAAEALPLNFKGVVGGNLRAIEAQQAVHALAAAQVQYLTSVTEYNQAQFQLLWAVGRPLDSGGVGPQNSWQVSGN